MVSSNGLLPIVMGIGLAALSGGTLAASRRGGQETRWREPLFVFAVLLIGLPVFGAALYELGWSIESGHKLAPGDARAENWLIVTLTLLLVALAARSAWIAYFYSYDGRPWERGHLDRLPQLFGFVMGSMSALLVGLAVDLIVLAVARHEPKPAILLVVATLALGLGLAWALLRLMTGGDPSPGGHAMSRRSQLRVLASLQDAAGGWTDVEVSAADRLEPPLALSAVVWMTPQGAYWRPDDAYALVRYHDWVANHLVAPAASVHTQRLMVANPTRRAHREITIRPWSGRRSVWRDALRLNRADRRAIRGASSPEHAAGLVHVPFECLSAAGLRIVTGRACEQISYRPYKPSRGAVRDEPSQAALRSAKPKGT